MSGSPDYLSGTSTPVKVSRLPVTESLFKIFQARLAGCLTLVVLPRSSTYVLPNTTLLKVTKKLRNLSVTFHDYFITSVLHVTI